MPNDGRIVLCPYYSSTTKAKIVCEDVPRRFRYRKHAERWLDKYCCADWSTCMYAKVLTEIYEKGGDMTQHTIDELKREIHKADTRIGRQEAQIRARDEQIKELRKKNRVLEDRASKMSISVDRLAQLERELFSLSAVYECRLAYMIDQYAGGSVREDDMMEWAKGKEYAVLAYEEDGGTVWKSVWREVKDDNADQDDVGAGAADEEEQPADSEGGREDDNHSEQDVQGI